MSESKGLEEMPFGIIQQEVEEQYTLFGFLEQYLQSPELLNSPMFAAMSITQKNQLLEQ